MIPKEQRIAIAKEIVDGSLSSREAAEKYGISKSLAAKYATDYRRENGLPVRTSTPRTPETKAIMLKSSNDSFHLEDYQSMTKDQLIEELIKSKINEARAKKGYEVKGDGQNKEFISLSSKNSKSSDLNRDGTFKRISCCGSLPINECKSRWLLQVEKTPGTSFKTTVILCK